MALVRQNNKQALTKAAKTFAYVVGQRALGPTGRSMIWNGANWIYDTVKRRVKRNDLVQHPGADPGALAAPVSVSRTVRGSRPKFSKSRGAVTVSHRELVGQIDSSASLVVNSGVTGNLYRVNPSNGVLFPWLQTLGANFDQYIMSRLSLQYVPLCASSDRGRVALYFDKDSQDAEPTDRVELANMAHLTEANVWAETWLHVKMDNIKRFTNDSNTADPKLLDVGQVGFATYGGGGIPIGDVFVHYTVTFFEPQPSAGLIETEQTGTGAANTGPNYVVVVVTSTLTTVTFRSPGTYLVSLLQRSLTLTSNATVGDITVNSQTNLQSGAVAYAAISNVTVNAAGASLTYTGTGFGNYTIQVTRAKRGNSATLL